MKDKNKNMLIIILVAVIVIGFTFFASELSDKGAVNVEKGKIVPITLSQYKQLYAKDDSTLVYIGKASCGVCTQFNPIMLAISRDNDMEIKYVDLDTLTDNEFSDLYYSNSFFEEEEWGTPTLLIVGNNKIKNYNIGYTDQKTVEAFLETAGIINE